MGIRTNVDRESPSARNGDPELVLGPSCQGNEPVSFAVVPDRRVCISLASLAELTVLDPYSRILY
jgi:hypothetical protein